MPRRSTEQKGSDSEKRQLGSLLSKFSHIFASDDYDVGFIDKVELKSKWKK